MSVEERIKCGVEVKVIPAKKKKPEIDSIEERAKAERIPELEDEDDTI